jgi:hypothetical protein
MGFSYQFRGWILFFEILTLIVYNMDIFFISRQYFRLRAESKVVNLPSESMEFQIRLNHDRDEIENKIRQT